MFSRLTQSKWLISLGLFLLALIPRLPDLGRFLTADEFLWVDRSRNFLAALTNPAFQCDSVVEKWGFVAEGLACTLRTGHPGVTTMWTGTFGFILRWLADGRPQPLHDYVVAVSTNPLDASFIAPERLGTVLLTSLWVVAVYWLVRRLWGAPLALVGALFLALDPFHVALSRVIHHDALSTTFMTLSILTMFIYWGQRAGRRWLLLSGAAAGLAFLSKSPALFLMPFVALVGLWFAVRRMQQAVGSKEAGDSDHSSPLTSYSLLLTPVLSRTLLDGLLWFAVAVAVFVACWPAMWVVPVETVETVFLIGSKYATGGHAKGNFFLGTISQDPGALFYPVTWLYRTSPLVLLGLLGLILTPLWTRRRPATEPTQPAPLHSFWRYLPLILLFLAGYYLLMTIGEKKQDRYFLPVYPWLNLLAAAGLLSITNPQGKRYQLPNTNYLQRFTFHVSRFTPAPIVISLLVLLLNGTLVAANYPYYFTYYNPLLGGLKGAESAMTLGWGEGLDLAAAYLNSKPNAAELRVASWYQSTFAPFFKGTALSYSEEKGKVLAGDYAVFYVNQTQRRFPDDALFDYYATHFSPEKTITLHGVDYAWIYPSLGVDHYIQDQTYTGIASLLAWQWTAGDDEPLIPGQPAEFDLYWEYLGKQPEEAFFFRLIDSQGRTWAEGQSRPVAAENPPPAQWREGEIIVERGTITPPRTMPPGNYHLQIGFYTQAEAVTSGELRFALPEAEALIPLAPADPAVPFTLPPAFTAINQPLAGALTLLGATWTRSINNEQLTIINSQLPITNYQLPPETPNPQSKIQNPKSKILVDLVWRVEQPLYVSTHLHVGLMDANGEAQQAWFNLSLAETFQDEATTWPPGTLLHTRWLLDLQPDLPPGAYHFELVWPEDISQTLPFGQVELAAE